MKILTLILFLVEILQIETIKYQISNYGLCTNKNYSYHVTVLDKIENNVQFLQFRTVMHKDFKDDNKIAIKVEKVFRNGKTKPLMERGRRKGCSTLIEKAGAAWLEVAALAKIPNPKQCPIQMNNYNITEWWQMDASKLPILKVVPLGKFRITVFINDLTGKEEICYRFSFEHAKM